MELLSVRWDISSSGGHIRFRVRETYNILKKNEGNDMNTAEATTHNAKWELFREQFSRLFALFLVGWSVHF